MSQTLLDVEPRIATDVEGRSAGIVIRASGRQPQEGSTRPRNP